MVPCREHCKYSTTRTLRRRFWERAAMLLSIYCAKSVPSCPALCCLVLVYIPRLHFSAPAPPPLTHLLSSVLVFSLLFSAVPCRMHALASTSALKTMY